ncbi:4087_t:CDS:1, partial [Scutellospora calospora]
REKFDNIASYFDLEFDYFSAISKYNRHILRKFGTADMDFAQKAVFISHYSIYKIMIDKGYNNVLILEDDVDFELNITAIMTDIHRDLPASWDVLYVGHCYESVGEQISKNSFVHKLYKSVDPLCTHAYAVSHSGVHKLVKFIDPVKPYGTIDHSLSALVREGNISSYSVHPQPIVQWKSADNPSDIPKSWGASFNIFNSTL